MVNLNKLKGLRAEHNMTQEDVAKALKITRVNYNMKESGKTKIQLEEAVELAKLFNVKIDDLLVKPQ